MLQHYISFQKVINTFCIFQFFIFIASLKFGADPFLYFLAACLPMNIAFYAYIHRSRLSLVNIIIIIIILMVFFIFAYLSPHPDLYKYLTILIGLSTFILSLIFRGESAFRMLFYFTLISNILILYTGYKYQFNPDFGNNIFINNSRNLVSAYLIFGTIYYLLFCYILNKKISLSIIILLFVNCLVLYGRTGVALSSLLLVYGLYKRFGSIVFIGIASTILISLNFIYKIIIDSTNFATGIDTPRPILFKEYISGMTTEDILFGRSIQHCCSTIVAYGSNPHNSFLMGHSFYGLIHTLLFLIIFVVILFSRRLELIFFTLIIFIRYNLDSFGLFGFSDLVLFSIFTYTLYINKYHKVSRF